MRFKKIQVNKKGFTLVEIMVSVAIFSMVVTAGMGALMSVLASYNYSQKEKKVADSISYVLENMTREIRLGFGYFLAPGDVNSVPGTVHNGSSTVSEGGLIGFSASDNRGYIIYHIIDGVLFKKQFHPDGSISDGALTDDTQVIIEKIRVTVMNAGNLDEKQALVWVQLKAKIPGTDSITVVQTLISQRSLDT